MTRVAPPNSGNGGVLGFGGSKSSTGNKQNIFWIGLGMILIVVFSLMSSSSGGRSSSTTSSSSSLATDGSKQAKIVETIDIKKEIQLSSVSIPTIGDVPFYQCKSSIPSSSSTSTTIHLMLLHGAKFTKEDWKSSGILEKFCNSNPHQKLDVTAMDLPVSAGHNDLKNLLNKMVEESHIEKLPIALITPSASGLTMSDWMKTGNIEEIPNYIFKWIPVASGSVKTVSSTQIESLKSLKKNSFGIFAIYGDQDKMGKTVSQYLHDHADAKTLELPGTHPVYLDSPDSFVQNVLEDLNLVGR